MRGRGWWCAGALVACAIGVGSASPAVPQARARSLTVRVRLFTFVDRSRTVRHRDGRRIARSLETTVRYPARRGASPLIVFAHGFALGPATYAALLSAWARAGFVVAAPAFPLEKASAPGGPSQSDLVNEPRDMSFVITRLLALNARSNGALARRIDPSRIAVAGHSDGGVAALSVAFDPRFRDQRIRAAIVLSGARLPGMGAFPRNGPPLLAVQGTGDAINPPAITAAYFRRARRPKFLLWLLGAAHLSPYTSEEPQLRIVEQATVGFLDRYLRHAPLRAFVDASRRGGLTQLVAAP